MSLVCTVLTRSAIAKRSVKLATADELTFYTEIRLPKIISIYSPYTIVGKGLELRSGLIKFVCFIYATWFCTTFLWIIGVVIFGHDINKSLYGCTVTSRREKFTSVVVERVNLFSHIRLGQFSQFFVSPSVSPRTLTPIANEVKSVERSTIGEII